MDVGTIRTALADQLAAALTIQIYDRATLNPIPPCMMITPEPFGPVETYDGSTSLRLLVLCLTASVDMGGGQDQLDRWISTEGEESIKVAVDADMTLGGTVESAMWMGCRDYTVMPLSDGGTVYLVAQVLVDVLV